MLLIYLALLINFIVTEGDKKRLACTKHKPFFKNTAHHKMHDTSSPLHRDINPSLGLQNRPEPTEPTIVLGTKE
jgi:hypothetical protein